MHTCNDWPFLGSAMVSNLRAVVCVNETGFVFQKFLADTFGQTNPSQVLKSRTSSVPLHFSPTSNLNGAHQSVVSWLDKERLWVVGVGSGAI